MMKKPPTSPTLSSSMEPNHAPLAVVKDGNLQVHVPGAVPQQLAPANAVHVPGADPQQVAPANAHVPVVDQASNHL